ncbi:hypothetical protein EVAR_52960_1 [Eumeta japonica]|uniref:Uncharacterized protein n=1 Tax=Eumeta variegata TaxID=151549 RepID=A0A4C1YYE0_EUMVA|nr:hypothetical protein EVAR_52960_1 [Eumeta japonica]
MPLPLKTLDEEIMGNYQAAFMRYRSTDDHIFVVRRILMKNGRQVIVPQSHHNEELKELLISVGLKLNETKTKMLVRDPINKSIAKQTQEINGVPITQWTPLNIWYVPDLRAESKRHDKGKM